MADEIFHKLQQQLGSNYKKNSAPVGTGISLAVSGFFMLVVFACTAFFYYGAYELESGAISPVGSSRTRGILNLLELLGTNGVLIIGGLLFILTLGLMIYLVANPPTVMELNKINSQKIERAPKIPLQTEQPLVSPSLTKPEQVIPTEPAVVAGTVFIDGLLSGLILGVVGAILPGIAIFTGDKQLARMGMLLDGILIPFSGVLTGILFQGRNIGKSKLIIPSGAIAGALTGVIAGMVLGLSPQNDSITNFDTQDGLTIYIMTCIVSPSFWGAIAGAFGAWIFSLTSKEARELDKQEKVTPSPQLSKNQKSNDSIGSRFMALFKRRMIVAAISIGVILVCTLCQSLLNGP